jgi:hypothetical protein
MNARYLLGIALAAATAVAACGSPDASQLGNGTGDGTGDPTATGNGTGAGTGTGTGTGAGTGAGAGSGTGTTPGTLPTASKAGKAFFIKSVDPILETKCSGCHTPGGIGNPSWMAKADAAKTYDIIYLNAYAVAQSRIVIKGVHSNGSAPELTAAEKSTWAQWIQLETADGGQKTQTNVLEKFGTCFDKTKFDAIKLGDLRTIRRQNGNNPQNLTENANNCTGCDNKPCSTCHSSDDVTGFVNAIGNNILPADYTFEQTKLLNPAFIRQYVSTTPTGEPMYNPGLMTKSTNTIEKAPAYSHPMFKITPTMETAIQDFVNDAITKQKAGTCGK